MAVNENHQQDSFRDGNGNHRISSIGSKKP